jgi:hypothetical protein
MDKPKVINESKAEQARQRRRLTKKPFISKHPMPGSHHNSITQKNLRKNNINRYKSKLTDENAYPKHILDGVECHTNENINRLVPDNYVSKSHASGTQSQPEAVSNPTMPFNQTPSQESLPDINFVPPVASASQSQSNTPSTPIINHYQLPTASF